MQTDPLNSQPLPVVDSEHLRILTALAEGVHPLTGHPLPDDSVYQHAKVLRALQSAISALNAHSKKKPKRAGMPEQAGKPWNPMEVAQLVQGFDSGMSVAQLAQKHQRTRGAIESRLVKLGKMPLDPRWIAEAAEKREKQSEPLLPPRQIVSPTTAVPEKDIPY